MKLTSTLLQTAGLLLSLGLTTEARSVQKPDPVQKPSPAAKGYSRTELCKPHHPFKPLPSSPPRTKTCHVSTYGDERDDSKFILSALKECNNGGKVVFDADKFYTIGTALDMTFLKHVDLDIQGYIKFTNDTDYWQENGFFQTYQNATTFFQLGGEDVNIYGNGTIDGNGQAWYDLYEIDDLILRPILMGIIGLNGGTIGPINLRYSPQWYHFVANSSDLLFDQINIGGLSNNNITASNTDGWDIYRSSNIVIQNSVIVNGDDCVSFKPNTTDVIVQNLSCNGSHGISVGSLGQYEGEVDIVENIYVYNITMLNAENGARIKVWPGVASELSADLQGGGGSGSVKNITYDGMYVYNVDYPIDVTQCYGQDNLTLCNDYPSSLTIADVYFKNIHGTSSGAYNPDVGTIVCSSPDVCSNIYTSDISLTNPTGGDFNVFSCANVNETLLATINCTST